MSVIEHAKHIELFNVPRTATPADVRRSINRTGVQGVIDGMLFSSEAGNTLTVFIYLSCYRLSPFLTIWESTAHS